MDPWNSFISSLSIVDMGATALVAITVIMILRGDLVPKSVSNAWRDAYLESQRASALKDQAIAQFAEAGLVSAKVLDSLPQPRGGEPNDVEETTETRRRRRQS